MEPRGGAPWWSPVVEPRGGAPWWSPVVEPRGGAPWWSPVVEPRGGFTGQPVTVSRNCQCPLRVFSGPVMPGRSVRAVPAPRQTRRDTTDPALRNRAAPPATPIPAGVRNPLGRGPSGSPSPGFPRVRSAHRHGHVRHRLAPNAPVMPFLSNTPPASPAPRPWNPPLM